VPEGLAKSDWANIRAAYEAGQHAFQPMPTGWQARNPGQQWTTSFDRRGFLAAPEAGWITAQVLTVDGGRMDYIGHG